MRLRTNHDLGWFALQHHQHKGAGYSLDLRACLVGVRVTGDRQKPLGRWTVKKGEYGDLNGALHWATAGADKRPIGSFFFTGVPAVIAAPPADTETQEGTNNPPPNTETVSGGTGTVTATVDGRSVDADHQQAGNPVLPKGPSGKKGAAAEDAKATAKKGGAPDGKTNVAGNPANAGKDGQGEKGGEVPAPKLMALPVRNKTWKADTRYKAMEVNPPGAETGQQVRGYPAGTRGLVVAGTEEDSQEALFIPMGQDLIAVNQAGNPEMGTLVFDLAAGDELDVKCSARLQSMMRVVKGPSWKEPNGNSYQEGNVLAFNLGPMTGRGDTPAGAFFYGDDFDAVLGWGSQRRGGPFSVAAGYETKHKTKGYQMSGVDFCESLHLSTHALFRDGATGPAIVAIDDADSEGNTASHKRDPVNEGEHDGPLCFEARFPDNVHSAPHRVHAHLEFHMMSGLWRWWAESFLYKLPKGDTPPPTDTPPTGGPPWEEWPQPKIPGKVPRQNPPDPKLPEDFVETAGRQVGIGVGVGIGGGVGGAAIRPFVRSLGGTGNPPGGIPPDGIPHSAEPDEDPLGLLGTLADPSVYERPWQESRSAAAMSTEVMMPAMVFRAQLFRNGAPWMTNWTMPDAESVRANDFSSPAVLRAEAYAAQGGTTGQDILDGATGGTLGGTPFSYLLRPTGHPGSPYPGGLANGGIVYLRPWQSLSDIDVDLLPVDNPGGTSYVTMPHGIRLGFGMPDLTDGGIYSGWAIGVDAAGAVTFTHVASTGVETAGPTLNANGTVSGFGSGVSGSGTPGTIPLFAAPTQLTDSALTQSGSDVYAANDFHVGAKLYVTGGIDPTYLDLESQAAIPDGDPDAGHMKIWAKTDKTLWVTDEDGLDTQIAPLTAAVISVVVSASPTDLVTAFSSVVTESPAVFATAVGGFTAPEAADFTVLNSATLTDVSTDIGAAVAVNAPSSGSTGTQRMKGGYKSIGYTSGTKTLVAGIVWRAGDFDYASCGLFFRESATGKIVTCQLGHNAAAWRLDCNNLSGPDGVTWVSQPSGTTQIAIMPLSKLFFKMTYDGTNMRMYVSHDFATWKQFATISKTEYFTTAPDEWGFFGNCNTASVDADVSCFHFRET